MKEPKVNMKRQQQLKIQVQAIADATEHICTRINRARLLEALVRNPPPNELDQEETDNLPNI
jgi:hypothetical protein